MRSYAIALAYLFGFTELNLLGNVGRGAVARKVFGEAIIDQAVERVTSVLHGWGQRSPQVTVRTASLVCHALLLNRSPLLSDLSDDVLNGLRTNMSIPYSLRQNVHSLHRALAALGHVGPPRPPARLALAPAEGVDPVWADWVQRWHDTSPLPVSGRKGRRNQMLRMGRWLAVEHPDIREPGQWTRELCAAWVAAVDRLRIGDFTQNDESLRDRIGEPLMPRTKSGLLAGARQFFRDCQEWGWIPRRFDPTRALATPRSIRALIGPDPRVIADDIWAKLLWAGLNLEHNDVYTDPVGRKHPIELLRALALTWLFAGLRSDEIVRLRVGCIRWQREDVALLGDTDEMLGKEDVCLLDVPVHKTGTAFTKPVDPIVGQAIAAWEAVRPTQPAVQDRKTSERVHLLFSYRAQGIGRQYLNIRIIPALCSKAGVPTADVRGNITSHRARSTIASQLYNAKEPMTLFELQAWLGHRSPSATQHYAKIAPTTLAKAYSDAGYFARNVRTIEVLVDRDAVASGAAASGQPWQYYDLGHGYCTYSFFEQCPHRMACARCDFYTPKDSSKAQLLEAKENLQRMLANLPLTEDEQAAVDDGQAALDRLLERLIDVPTPDGATPREIAAPASSSLLPIVAVNQRK
ncbi:tyrosine-type recombinase/integrase [Nocardia abscessus]|uniref:tyrosine-type recombinase/integrase n=1 Tax=Nocardia abscessus TaxID=120957 RepID=UPI00031DEF64|nr:tyrosine-type recombinase/integrase [Nocardia abscessus]MCC3328343.1 tyrosine-type recombinase/integrase [Nocardia abscessus]